MTMETGSHWQAAADDDDDDEPHVVVSRIKEGTRKRLYEHGEEEEDREMDKLYKRDYWEDPAYAPLLELSSLGTARAEAVICFSHRTLRATYAMLPSVARSGSAAVARLLMSSRSRHGPPPPAAAAKVVCSVSGDQSWTA